ANPEPQALELRVLIDDALHDRRGTDRYIGVVSVAPHAREMIRIPLEEIERGPGDRMLDLTQITAVMLFRADGNRVVRCYLGPIRLE
ncbi:MAG TPA: hypothetical protein VLT59_06985, partial [Steroidobacteraceae bacterium]|nr:hypothetical protein [Steroidobacteraceae bacterium]